MGKIEEHLKKEFEDYKLLHEFIYSKGTLESWINEYNFINLFKSDWNELMLVLNKISDICFTDDGEETYDSEMFYRIRDCIPDVNQTYKASLEFIKLYNKNK